MQRISADSYRDEHKTPRNITKITCDLANMNSSYGCYSAVLDFMDVFNSLFSFSEMTKLHFLNFSVTSVKF